MGKRTAQREFISAELQKKIIDVYLTQHTEEEWKSWSLEHHIKKRITYDGLPEVLDVCGLKIRDMYQLSGIALQWPSEEFRLAAELFEALPPQKRRRAYDILSQLVPEVLIHLEEQRPTKRIILLYRRENQARNIRNDSPEFMKKSMKNPVYVTIHTEHMVQASQELNVSLHWIFAFDERTAVYGTIPETDQMLDLFSFASPVVKRAFLASLQKETQENREGDTK